MTKLSLIIVVVSYLLGSIPFGYLLVRIFRGQDVRNTGSGNIGATNVARTGSKGLAIATLVLDALKGYFAVAFAFWLAGSRRFAAGDIQSSLYDSSPQMIDSRTIFLLAAVAGILRDPGAHVPGVASLQGRQGSSDCRRCLCGARTEVSAAFPSLVCDRVRADAVCFLG